MRWNRAVILAVLALAAGGGAAWAQGVENGSFDQHTIGWTLFNFSPAWQAVDADGSPGSGSLRVSVPGGGPLGGIAAYQCVAVTGGVKLSFTAKVRSSASEQVAALGFRAFPDAACASGLLLGGQSFYSPTVAGSWVPARGIFTTPPGTQSVMVYVRGGTTSGGAAEVLEYDDVDLEPSEATSCSGISSLCLDSSNGAGDGRFEVYASYYGPRVGGSFLGHAISMRNEGVGQGGVLWFFDRSNPELLVKVLDGCAIDGYFWVYISAGTDVGVDLLIGDTATGNWYLSHSPDTFAFPNIQNVHAISCDTSVP